jgi:structural maintenance of chromosome 4
MKDAVELMKSRRTNEFLAGFNTISNKLKELYRIITLGGDAELELVDSMEPFSEGIHFTSVNTNQNNRILSCFKNI